MSQPSVDQARQAVITACAEPLRAAGLDPDAVGDDLDLRESGVIDSLGFVELIVELEQVLGVDLDLDTVDPARMTIVGELVAMAAAAAHDDDHALS